MAHHSIHQMWENFKKINPDAPERYAAWSFGNSKKMTDKLAQLVIAGIKTATSSNYLLYDENEAIPYPGLHHIILDGNGKAAAIVETTFVEVVPFDQVTEEHAYLEVEGDRTLKYWRMCTKTFLKKNSRQSIKRSILKYL